MARRRKSPRCAPRWPIRRTLHMSRRETPKPRVLTITLRPETLNSPAARPIQTSVTDASGSMSFHVVEMPPSPLGAANARQSELARLVEALNVELAGEKIDLPSFPDVATR